MGTETSRRDTATEKYLSSELPPDALAIALTQFTVSQLARQHALYPATLTRYARRVLTAAQWRARIKGAQGNAGANRKPPKKRALPVAGKWGSRDSPCANCALCAQCRVSVLNGGPMLGNCEK